MVCLIFFTLFINNLLQSPLCTLTVVTSCCPSGCGYDVRGVVPPRRRRPRGQLVLLGQGDQGDEPPPPHRVLGLQPHRLLRGPRRQVERSSHDDCVFSLVLLL